MISKYNPSTNRYEKIGEQSNCISHQEIAKVCKKQFELKGSLPHTLDAEVSITLFASFLMFSLGSLIFNYLNLIFINEIILYYSNYIFNFNKWN